jgi:hypothetical protein
LPRARRKLLGSVLAENKKKASRSILAESKRAKPLGSVLAKSKKKSLSD